LLFNTLIWQDRKLESQLKELWQSYNSEIVKRIEAYSFILFKAVIKPRNNFLVA
jgi:hypothetical protein